MSSHTAVVGTAPQVSLDVESLGPWAKRAGWLTLDCLGKTVDIAEVAIDKTASAINAVVPSTVRFVGGLLVPEFYAHVVNKATEGCTHLATTLGKVTAKAFLHGSLFGLPAMIQAGRRYAAVADATGELSVAGENSAFLARSFAESTECLTVKKALLEYLDLRQRVRVSNASSETPQSSEELRPYIRRLALLEVQLKDYEDFRNLKLILDGGTQQLKLAHATIEQVARFTAERLVKRVEEFYQVHAASFAGEIKGRWSELVDKTLRSESRQELIDRIHERLAKAFQHEMNSPETAAELRTVKHELCLAFDVYRSALKAGGYLLLGTAHATDTLAPILQSVWTHLSSWGNSALGWLWDHSIGAAIDATKQCIRSQVDLAVDQLKDSLAENARELIEKPLEIPKKVAPYTLFGVPFGLPGFLWSPLVR